MLILYIGARIVQKDHKLQVPYAVSNMTSKRIRTSGEEEEKPAVSLTDANLAVVDAMASAGTNLF